MIGKVANDLCREIVRRNCEVTVGDKQNDQCRGTAKMLASLYRLYEAATCEEDSFYRSRSLLITTF